MDHLAKLEALLFVAGEEGLSLRQLSEVLHLPPTALMQQLDKLKETYQTNESSALELIETANTYKLVTKPMFAELLKEYAKSPVNQTLSRASLEVLSIIAYKQPMTRVEIDQIRGVNSSSAISKLLLLGLIQEAGKKEVIGRPNLYATTEYFLDFMGINQLDELVDISDIHIENEQLVLFKETESEIENEN